MKSQKKEYAKKVLKERIVMFEKYIKEGLQEAVISDMKGYIKGYAYALYLTDVISHYEWMNVFNKVDALYNAKLMKEVDRILDS